MEDNFEQLKALKEMLESGAISKSEFDAMKADLLRKSMATDGIKSAMEPSASSKFFSKYKWVIVAIPVLAIGGYFLMKSLRPDPVTEAQKLADEYCECQNQNNTEYIRQLNDFITEFDSAQYEFSDDVESKLENMSNSYLANTLNVSISTCFKNFNVKLEEAKTNYKNTTTEGKDFWFAFQSKITQNIDLTAQTQQITELQTAAFGKKGNICYDDESALKSRQNSIFNKMNGFYSGMSGGYLDAFDYFSYNVERYLSRKNISPTDINLIIKDPDSDYQTPSWKISSETMSLVDCKDEIETWEFATEFMCYRPNREQWQISNVWYEVKLNNSDKITSYREKKVERTSYMDPEEYNERFGGGYSEWGE
jgi:hypothetical protein